MIYVMQEDFVIFHVIFGINYSLVRILILSLQVYEDATVLDSIADVMEAALQPPYNMDTIRTYFSHVNLKIDVDRPSQETNLVQLWRLAGLVVTRYAEVRRGRRLCAVCAVCAVCVCVFCVCVCVFCVCFVCVCVCVCVVWVCVV